MLMCLYQLLMNHGSWYSAIWGISRQLGLFHDIMHCRRRNMQILSNLSLRKIVFKTSSDFSHSFVNKVEKHLYIFDPPEIQPLLDDDFCTKSSLQPSVDIFIFFIHFYLFLPFYRTKMYPSHFFSNISSSNNNKKQKSCIFHLISTSSALGIVQNYNCIFSFGSVLCHRTGPTISLNHFVFMV